MTVTQRQRSLGHERGCLRPDHFQIGCKHGGRRTCVGEEFLSFGPAAIPVPADMDKVSLS